MAEQQERIKAQPQPQHVPVNQLAIPELRPDRVPRPGQSRGLVLEFLDYLFQALVVISEAYHHMYPTDPPDQIKIPCNHESHPKVPEYVQITPMAGQLERMTYVGLLLRTADQIRYLKAQTDTQHNGRDFASKMVELKRQRPEIAHGVAVLNFLTAGLCRNDSQTLENILDLVRTLRWQLEYQSGQNHTHQVSIQVMEFYTNQFSNCTLRLVNALLDNCNECKMTNRVRRKIRKLSLRPDLQLDLSQWLGCGDCESMLVDILVNTYTLSSCHPNILSNRIQFRMMASLKLSLHYAINVEQNHGIDRAIVDYELHQFEDVRKQLRNFGFTEVPITWIAPSDHTATRSIDFEVMFVSGYQEKKGNLKRFLLEEFLQHKERRPFFIQCQHQFLRCDPGRKHCEPQMKDKSKKRCCEPQVKTTLGQVTQALHDTHSKLTIMQPDHRGCMVLEEYPCDRCGEDTIPSMVDEMGLHGIPLQIVSMLPYCQNSRFLQRLTNEGGPVQLNTDLHPFEERQVCLVDTNRHCGFVRCRRGNCQYSNPSNVLTVDVKKLYSTQFPKEKRHCWMAVCFLFLVLYFLLKAAIYS